MQKNTVTVDIGPLLVAIGYKNIGEQYDVDMPSFGIAAQYERQLMEKLSLAARFAYLSFGIGSSSEGDKSTMDTSSFSIEGHVRGYPGGDVFFIDGMLGYANISAKYKGEERKSHFDPYLGTTYTNEKKEYSISRGYFKYGFKIGWRVTFGEPVGFVFEPSFGWNGGVGLGDTLGKQEGKKEGREDGGSSDNYGWNALEQWVFVGGPRLSLAFGVRF